MSLTAKQRDVLLFIDKYQELHNDVSPSFEEIAAGVGMKSKGHVHEIIKALEERGYLKRIKHRERALTVLKRPFPSGLGYALLHLQLAQSHIEQAGDDSSSVQAAIWSIRTGIQNIENAIRGVSK